MSLSQDLQSLALALRAAQDARRADPLAGFGWPSDKHKRAFAYVVDGLELHLRAANYGAKTFSGAAFAVACARGVPMLDGITVPVAKVPNVGAVVVRDYGQQVDSSQAAILHWLGDYPHEVSWINKGLGYAGTIRIKPEGWTNPDPETWSRIVFVSQENADKALGARWDWAWGDEPPIEAIWREVRKNCKHLWITETPLKRSEWEWLQTDFAGCLWTPRDGRVEATASLYDNRFLSSEDVARLEARYRGDKLIKARLYGDYVDADGECPFDYDALNDMKARCVAGEAWEHDRRVVLWRGPERGKSYRITLDPSSGIAGRDKAGLWLVSVDDRAGIGRLYDHVPVAGLGRAALRLAREYNDAELVPEMNGGWGEALLAEWGDYRNVWREKPLDNVTRRTSNRVGWWTDESSRGVIVSALQRCLLDDSLSIPSVEAVDALMAIRIGDRDKLIRAPHQNWEDMICLGIQAHLLNTVRKPRRYEVAEMNAGMGRVQPLAVTPPWLDRGPKRQPDAEWNS